MPVGTLVVVAGVDRPIDVGEELARVFAMHAINTITVNVRPIRPDTDLVIRRLRSA